MAIEFPAPAAFLKFLTRGRVGDDVHARYAVMSACIFPDDHAGIRVVSRVIPVPLVRDGFFCDIGNFISYITNCCLFIRKEHSNE